MASSFPEPWFSHTQDNSDCGEAFFVMESSESTAAGKAQLQLLLISKFPSLSLCVSVAGFDSPRFHSNCATIKAMLRRALIFVFLCAATVLAQSYSIVELKSTGSKRYKAEDILRVAGLETGKTTSLDTVRNAAQLLVNTGVFLEVRYSHTVAPEGINVAFDVKDKPADQYLKCDFSNLVWFSPEELNAALKEQLPLFDGTLPAGGGSSDQAAAVIEKMLEKKNVHTHVSALDESPAQGKPIDSVTFRPEDAKVIAASFEFPGVSAAFQDDLQKSVAALLGKEYNRTLLANHAADKLGPIYRAKGFLRANFDLPTSTNVTVTDAGTTVTAVIPVHEGLAYSFEGAELKGNKVFTTEKLAALVKSPVGAPLNGVKFDAEVESVKALIDDDGYFRSKVEAKPAYDDAAKTVHYTLNIFEGDRYTMGKLEVEGALSNAAMSTLQAAWKQREGAPYSKSYTKNFLRTFRFSTPVNLRIEETPDDKTLTVDVTIIVKVLTQAK